MELCWSAKAFEALIYALIVASKAFGG